MAELRRWTDRFGRTVVLDEELWFDKIDRDHDELGGDPDLLAEALMNPDRVHYDRRIPEGENFYRRGILRQPYERDYLKVCVRYRLSVDGLIEFVVSAFAVDEIHEKERRTWSR
jgi:hypothetical protein